MTCGVQSKSVDLDLIFDALRAGQPQARATGAKILGADPSTRWAPLSAGSAAANTGIDDQGTDFAALYAKIGTSGGTPACDYTFTTNALVATFTDASTDPGGTIGSWAWNFGDGGTSTAQSPSHTFASANTYNVTLTITDSRNGKQSSKTLAVPISGNALGFSGVSYESVGNLSAKLTLTFGSTTTWGISGSGTVTGSPLSGALAAGATQVEISNLVYNSTNASVQGIPANTPTPITAGMTVLQYNTTGLTGNAVNCSCTVTLKNSSGAIISTSSLDFTIDAKNGA